MVKTKTKMMINFYLLDDNMAPLRVECRSGPACPLVLKPLYPCQLGLCVCTNFQYPSSYFSLLPFFLDESFSSLLRIRS